MSLAYRPPAPRSTPPAAAPPTAAFLAELRGMLAGEVHVANARLARIETVLAARAAALAAITETIDQLRVRLLAAERAAGSVEKPQVPHFSRRKGERA